MICLYLLHLGMFFENEICLYYSFFIFLFFLFKNRIVSCFFAQLYNSIGLYETMAFYILMRASKFLAISKVIHKLDM
jgi:hypothetical protein